MDSATGYDGDGLAGQPWWLQGETLTPEQESYSAHARIHKRAETHLQPSISKAAAVATLTAPPIISQISSTSLTPVPGDANEASLYNPIDHDPFSVNQWEDYNEVQHTAFPWAWDSVECQRVPVFPDALNGWEGGSAGPVSFNTEIEYAPALPMRQNFPQLPSEVLPVANSAGFENAAIISDTPMAFAMEDFGTQPFAFEAEDASGIDVGQTFQDFCPDALPAAAESITDSIRPANNPTQQVQADGSIQRQQMPKPFQCDYPGCNSKGFSRKYELQRHMKKHSRSQLFLCPVAGCHFQQLANAFYRHDKLGCHMRSCHSGVQIPPTNGPVPPAQASMTSSVGQNVPAQLNMQG